MGIEKYKAVFIGEIVSGVNFEQVKKNLALLFKCDATKIDGLFNGKPVVLKQGMTIEEAQQYRLGFERTGARCTIQKIPLTQAPPTAVKTPIREIQYKVMFKGEIIYGKKKNDVIAHIAHTMKMNLQQVMQWFTGKPITLKGPVDFWTASQLVKRFKQCGAICDIEIVNPSQVYGSEPKPPQPVAAAPPPPVPQKGDPKPAPTSVPATEAKEIESKSKVLYDRLTNTYTYILEEFKIAAKSKKLEKQEGALGCFFLLIFAALIAMVIWTSLKWYMGLLYGLGLLVLLSFFVKEWNLKYVDIFLTRVDVFKKENPPLFIVTLNKWVNDLPKTDRARVHLQNLTAEAIRKNPGMKGELDRYAEVIGPLVQTVPDAAGSTESEINALEQSGKIKKEPQKVFCPRCGSDFITEDIRGFSWKKGIAYSMFFGPLAGAVMGSSKEGEAIYVCGKCNKKWKR
jgi:hypothetical protein